MRSPPAASFRGLPVVLNNRSHVLHALDMLQGVKRSCRAIAVDKQDST